MTTTPPPLSPEIQEQLRRLSKCSKKPGEGTFDAWCPWCLAHLRIAEAAYRLGASEVQQLQRECDDNNAAANLHAAEHRKARQELAEAHARLREMEQAQQSERERLHGIIEQCYGLIDPEEHPHLSAEIDAVLLPCDEAGRCVSPAPVVPPQEGQDELHDIRKYLVTDCGMRDEGTTLDMVRGVAYVARKARHQEGRSE